MLDRLNQSEADIIDKFAKHPLFLNLKSMDWEKFLDVLLQRRFLSLQIVNIYEIVIDSIVDKEAKQTIRSILHEEYPRSTRGIPLPSHRELLFQDLLNLGSTREQIISTAETDTTKRIRTESFQCFTRDLSSPKHQIGTIAALRFWAEVLVGVEYRCFWPKLSERLSQSREDCKPRSEFYLFHMMHDARGSDVGREGLLGGLTHSQELALHLNQLIQSNDDLQRCIDIEQEMYELKCCFYNQFL